MVANRQPTLTELNGKNQDTVQWPAKATRVTAVLSDGSEITNDNPLPVMNFGGLVPEGYDEIMLTYVTSGDGIGEIETVTYKKDSSTLAILTLSYNGDDKLVGVVRS